MLAHDKDDRVVVDMPALEEAYGRAASVLMRDYPELYFQVFARKDGEPYQDRRWYIHEFTWAEDAEW